MPAHTVISSNQNPRIRDVMRLRERRHRDRTGEMLIEGVRELGCAVKNSYVPHTIYFCPQYFSSVNEDTILATARDAGADIVETTAAVFAKLSYRDRPDGLLGVGKRLVTGFDDLALSVPAWLLVAESIEKPGNLGTMLRSADATGVDAVVVCDRKTDVNNPNVVRASIGTLFCVPVIEAETDATLDFIRQHGIQIVAATPSAGKPQWDCDLRRPVALVVGSEDQGLSDRWLDVADIRVSIPMHGKADSLNVATAATLLMYEALRQRSAS